MSRNCASFPAAPQRIAARIRFSISSVRISRLSAKDIEAVPKSHIERFMRSLKDECLHRLIFFGQKPLQAAAVSYLAHYHAERNHQGLDNRLIDPGEEVGRSAGEVECRERLGRRLRYYHRKAA